MPIIGANIGPPARVDATPEPLANDPPLDELNLALSFARAEKAEASRRAYGSDFELFRRWCEARKLCPLPATSATVAAFLACEVQRGSKASSITRRVAGIRHAHVVAGHTSPTSAEIVKSTLRGIRRSVGTAPARKAPLTADLMINIAEALPNTMIGLRNRALLLIGFAGALRRSELVGLDVGDLSDSDAGLRIRIRASKTDAEQQGVTIAVARGGRACPVAALQAWLKAASIKDGPVFRPVLKGGQVTDARLSDHAVAEIVKACAKGLALDAKSFSGHSLRAGFLTSAAKRGASLFKMMDVSRHRSVETLSGYVRDCEFFHDHAGAGLL